jgi:hypothetical protein
MPSSLNEPATAGAQGSSSEIAGALDQRHAECEPSPIERTDGGTSEGLKPHSFPIGVGPVEFPSVFRADHRAKELVRAKPLGEGSLQHHVTQKAARAELLGVVPGLQ